MRSGSYELAAQLAQQLTGRQPLAEEPRYNWEPLALKLFAYRLEQRLGAGVESTIWHLFGGADEEAQLTAAAEALRDELARF